MREKRGIMRDRHFCGIECKEKTHSSSSLLKK